MINPKTESRQISVFLHYLFPIGSTVWMIFFMIQSRGIYPAIFSSIKITGLQHPDILSHKHTCGCVLTLLTLFSSSTLEERDCLKTGKQESFINLVRADWKLICCPFQWKWRGLKRANEPDYLNYYQHTINLKERFRYLPWTIRIFFGMLPLDILHPDRKKISTGVTAAITMRSS